MAGCFALCGMRFMSAQRRLSKNIQRIRHDKGLSQEEVAHRAEVHQTYLSGVETGQRNPSVKVVERIANALGVDIADLFKAD